MRSRNSRTYSVDDLGRTAFMKAYGKSFRKGSQAPVRRAVDEFRRRHSPREPCFLCIRLHRGRARVLTASARKSERHFDQPISGQNRTILVQCRPPPPTSTL